MKTNWQTKKLLIVGIPGMGKTKIGDYLSENYDFTHIDMESKSQNKINNLENIAGNIVVTWGFVPNEQQTRMVENLRDDGFKLIWIDGDRDAAQREFIKRDSQYGEEYLMAQLGALKVQLQNIENSGVIKRINPKIYNTFDREHTFKDIKIIVKEIQND